MLTTYAMAELLPNPAYVPLIESLLEDPDPWVRQVAEFAFAKATGKESGMPPVLEYIEKLKKFALFEGLATRELHAVASIANHQIMPAGDILIRAGEENPSIYLIISGKIITYHDYGTPDQKEIHITEANGYLNFVPMFTNQPPANTSIVTEESEIIILAQSHFHEIMRIYPQIGLNLLKIAAGFFRQMGFTA